MYRLAPPSTIKCSNCGEIVKIDQTKAFLSEPPCYHWECVKCGSEGYISSNDLPIAAPNSSVIKIPEAIIDNDPAPKYIPQGWQCPQCGAIIAPHQSYCPFCSIKESDWIITVGTGTQPVYKESPSLNIHPLHFNQRGDLIDVK